jgi:PAS domain-containing protein
MQHKTGRIGWVESMCMPIFDDGNQVIGTVGINRDITERKQAEEKLWKSNVLFNKAEQIGKLGHCACC